MQCKIKEGSTSKELEDSLLDVNSFAASSSSSSASVVNPVSVSSAPSSDEFLFILAKLDSIQRRFALLEKFFFYQYWFCYLKEVVSAELTSDQEGD